MLLARLAKIQLCFATDQALAAMAPQGLRAADPAKGKSFYIVDSRQAAAALGEELQALSLTTQPKVTVPPSFREATAMFGAALVAIADVLA